MDISVIIPTYNRLWCLPRAVDSCRHTKCRTQIIVVDDGSTDGTWEWLKTQSDVLALRQPNQGKPWAVNLAFASSRGRFIRLLDSDDFLAPGAIDLQFKAALATGAGVVYGRVDDYDEATKAVTVYPDTPQWDDFIAVMLGEGYGSHFLGMQFARELVQNAPHRPEFAYRDDRMFLLEVALQHPLVHATAGCTGYWVKHTRQMHTGYHGLKTTVAAWQMWKLYEHTLNRLEATGELTPRRARAATRVLWSAAHEIARSHLADAAIIAKRVYELEPAFVPPETKFVVWLYRRLGYVNTQRLFRLRRILRGRAS